jgi:endogenous inhibitor of DNA gyrase (YacG/DUF329 family)
MTKVPANTNKPCPICGKPADEKFKPFCSARCADVDLHRWLGGVYRVESDEPPGDEGGRDPE